MISAVCLLNARILYKSRVETDYELLRPLDRGWCFLWHIIIIRVQYNIIYMIIIILCYVHKTE